MDENSAAGIEVADLNNAVSYYLKDAIDPLNDGNFKIDATTGVVTTARPFDYEEDGGSLSFIAVSVDSNGGEAFSTYEVPIRNLAETRVVDFAGINKISEPVPDGYSGFNWSDGIFALDFSPGPAYVFSQGTAVFETPALNGATSGANFNLSSLEFFSGDGITSVRITGSEDGVVKYTSQDISLIGTSFSARANVELTNWIGIDKVTIDVVSGSGTWYMGNIVIGENVGVDFEGVDTVPLVNGYGGLNWESSNGVVAGFTPDVYGYDTIDFSGGQLFDIAPTNEIAWNAGAGKNTVVSAITPDDNFTLVSLDLVNDQRPLEWGPNQLRITGYDGTSAIETADITLTESLTTHVLNWEGIDSIHIDVIGGTFQGDQTAISSGFWGMDNLIVV